MTEVYAIIVFLFVLFALLGSSVWVGLALMGVAWVGMELFTSRPAGDAMITTIWTGASSWTLTALPNMWRYYLSYCEGGFRERIIGTYQITMTKPGYRPA